jgi:hypothetical protein
MRDLEKRIEAWRNSMRKSLGTDAIEELEEHLREAIAAFVKAGRSEDDAFEMAVKQLGAPRTLRDEFDKVNGESWWALKAAWAFTALGTISLFGWFLVIGLKPGDLRWLLASHVFAVTGGYLGTLMVGALGICFVCQRCIEDFTPSRQQYLGRATVMFAAISTAATAIGIGLGMIWAKQAWDRYWGWDYVEVGGLGILTWLLLFLAAGSTRIIPARALMLMAIAGNIVVTLGWFGANGARHNYGPVAYSMIALAIVTHLIFIAIGFGPAGWIRLRKAA